MSKKKKTEKKKPKALKQINPLHESFKYFILLPKAHKFYSPTFVDNSDLYNFYPRRRSFERNFNDTYSSRRATFSPRRSLSYSENINNTKYKTDEKDDKLEHARLLLHSIKKMKYEGKRFKK